MPLSDKLLAMKDIAIPTNKKLFRSIIGIINYYRDIWIHRSDILAP